MQNTTKVWLFFLVSSLCILFAGYYMGGRWGLLLSFFLACAFHWSLYYWGSSQILKNYDSRKLLGPDQYGLFDAVQSHYEKLNRKAPDVFLLDCEDCVVMALSFTYKPSALAISEWFLEKLSAQEKAALYKLLLSRLEVDNNIWALSLNQLTNILNEVGDFLDRINPIRFIFARKIPFFSPISRALSFLILKLAYRKNLFFQIDQKALSLMANPLATARVLDKIESYSQTRPPKVQDRNWNLYLVDPRGNRNTSLFSFHQPVRLRIANLIGYYPL